MKITDIISVNPGKTALGHVDKTNASIFRSHIVGVETHNSSLSLTKVLFPSSLAGTTEYRKYEVPLRTLFATILIVTGLSMLTIPVGIHGVAFAVATLSFGAFLALGFLTRPVMIGAAIFYCISGALSLRAGIADMTIFSLMFGCLIFGIIGAGKYSCDTLIIHELKKRHKLAEQKKKDDLMGYKAFHSVRF